MYTGRLEGNRFNKLCNKLYGELKSGLSDTEAWNKVLQSAQTGKGNIYEEVLGDLLSPLFEKSSYETIGSKQERVYIGDVCSEQQHTEVDYYGQRLKVDKISFLDVTGSSFTLVHGQNLPIELKVGDPKYIKGQLNDHIQKQVLGHYKLDSDLSVVMFTKGMSPEQKAKYAEDYKAGGRNSILVVSFHFYKVSKVYNSMPPQLTKHAHNPLFIKEMPFSGDQALQTIKSAAFRTVKDMMQNSGGPSSATLSESFNRISITGSSLQGGGSRKISNTSMADSISDQISKSYNNYLKKNNL